jgi:diketogulonate reductase-like aldo/keto reductase
VIFAVTTIYFPFFMLFKNIDLEKKNELLVECELTANQIALHVYTRQTRGHLVNHHHQFGAFPPLSPLLLQTLTGAGPLMS